MQIKNLYNLDYDIVYNSDTIKTIIYKFKININREFFIILRRDQTIYNIISRDNYYLTEENSDFRVDYLIDPIDFFLYDDDLVEDAIKIMYKNKIKILPVVDTEMFPLGTFAFYELIKSFKEVSALDEPGTKAIIVLDDIPGQLSNLLAVLSKENINILSLITSKINSNKRALSIKFNIKDVNYISDIFEKNDLEYETIFEEEPELD